MKQIFINWFKQRFYPSFTTCFHYSFIYLGKELIEQLADDYCLKQMNKLFEKNKDWCGGHNKWYKLYTDYQCSYLEAFLYY